MVITTVCACYIRDGKIGIEAQKHYKPPKTVCKFSLRQRVVVKGLSSCALVMILTVPT